MYILHYFHGQNLQVTEQQEERDNEQLLLSSTLLKPGQLVETACNIAVCLFASKK